MQERSGKIREQLETELDRTPAADWAKLDALGQVETPGFSAANRASEINQVLHGGLFGWNDEPRVFRALGGLTKVQGMALRRLYSLPPSSGGYDKDLDDDIHSELGGAERTRAEALLAGDQTLADVATLREAMHGGITGWGTDEKAIMETLRNKTPEERERIKALYEEKYDTPLEDDIKEELTGIFEDENDYARAQALMQGDTTKADAIAIDQAMYGGLTGWGTDRKAIEGVYDQIRQDTEKQLQEEARRTGKQLTTKELEAEVARRNQQLEASYNATYKDQWGEGDESALRRAYKDELSDGELALVNAIADNDLTKADAARIQIEKESIFYADDEVINGVLKHQYERALDETKRDEGPALYEDLEKRRLEAQKSGHPWDAYRYKKEQHLIERQLEDKAKKGSKVYMQQLESTYDTDFGTTGKGSLRQVIEQNMDGYEQLEARRRLAHGGWLTPAEEIHFATEGLGTKEDAFTKALEGKTKEEIAEIRKEWEKLHPGESLEDRIDSETSGRLNFELRHKLKGEPMSMEEERESMQELAKHEQEHGSSWFADDERKRLDYRLAEMEKKYQAAKDPNLTDDERARRVAEFQRFAGYTNVSVQEHKEKMEAVTGSLVTAVTTAIAVAVAAIAIIFSGGTATPGVVAAFAAWAGTAGGAATIAVGTALVGMGIKQAMLGSDYGIEDVGTDLAVGGVEAVAAAATAGLSKALFLSRAEKLVESLGKGLTTAERQALITALEKQPEFAKGWFATMAQSTKMSQRMIGHGLSGALFGAAGAVPSGLARTVLDSKTWEGGGAWEKILSGTGEAALSGTLAGAGMGAIGGIKAPHAPGHLPGAGEPTARPSVEHDVLPPGGTHTSETLKTGLPPDLQKNVPIHVDPELEGNSVRVHYDVDEHGVLKDIHIRAGPTATPRDIELHVNTVRVMKKYAGLQGRVRAMIRRARGWVTRNGPPRPGSRAWEAKLEVEKLPRIIEDRMDRLGDPDLDPKVRAELEASIDHLEGQLAEHESVLASAMPDEKGRGFVAAEGRRGKAPAVAEEETKGISGRPPKKGATVVEEPVERPAVAARVQEKVPSVEAVESPTPTAEEKTRAEKATELVGRAKDAENDLVGVRRARSRLETESRTLEERIETAEAEGRVPYRGDVAKLNANEAEIQQLYARELELQRTAFEARSELGRLAGTPEERARWEDFSYDDLGKSPGPCFVAGTLIHSLGGCRRIEDLVVGEAVWTRDLETGAIVPGHVLKVLSSWTSHLQLITLEGETIASTRLHRFWDDREGVWKEARRLWGGDRLLTLDGQQTQVTATESLSLCVPTFNLEIHNNNNFFVGRTGVLVHNGDSETGAGTATMTVSAFAKSERRPTSIYLVIKKNAQGTWEDFYVGKTVQGEGDPLARFKGHLDKKPSWKAAYERGEIHVLEEPIAKGNWTDFETAVMEEHKMQLHGGLKRDNPDSTLTNEIHALDREKFEKFRDDYGHNPCAVR
jgi:hypothetical protein